MSAQRSPIEAEIVRLRAEGFTDRQIEIILERKADAGRSTQATGSNSATGNSFGPQGPMSGVLSNGIAAISYIVRWIPSIKDDVRNACNDKAPPVDRVMAFGQMAIKLAVLAVIAFALKQEWDIHIISAHETAAAQAVDTKAKAAVESENSEFWTSTVVSPERKRTLICNDPDLRQKYGDKNRCDELSKVAP